MVVINTRSQKRNSFAMDALFAGRFDGLSSIFFLVEMVALLVTLFLVVLKKKNCCVAIFGQITCFAHRGASQFES